MVLIIGLINMTGVSQTPAVQADTINTEGPQLSDLVITGVSGDSQVAGAVTLNQVGSADTGFLATVGDYTASVAFGVNYVTVAPTAADPVTATTSSHKTDANPAAAGHQVALTAGATTTIRATASGNSASQTYVVKVKRQMPQMPAASLVVKEGSTTTSGTDVTLNPAYVVATADYKAPLEYDVEEATIGYVAPVAGDATAGSYRTIISVSPDNSGVAEDGYQMDLTPGQPKKATISYSRQIFLGWIRATMTADDPTTPDTDETAVDYSHSNTSTPPDSPPARTTYRHTLYPGSMSDGWSSTSTMRYTIEFLRAKPALAHSAQDGSAVNGLILHQGQSATDIADATKRIPLVSDDHPDSNYIGNLASSGTRNYYVFLKGTASTPTGTVTSTQPTGTDGEDFQSCAIGTGFTTSNNDALDDDCRGKNGNDFYTPAANKTALGFASLVTNYTAEVDFDVATVTLTYTLVGDPANTPADKELKADLVSGETGDPKGVINHLQVALNPGKNTIQLQVSQSGLLYTVVVTRSTPILLDAGLQIKTVKAGATSSPIDLSSLKQKDGTAGFLPTVKEYTLEMGYDVDSLVVAAEAAFGVAKFTKPMEAITSITPPKELNVPLSQGSGNVIEIKVSDPNADTSVTTYKITVTRKPVPLSGLALSSGGAAVDLSPSFKMDTMEYDASVSYASDSIRVTPGVPSNISSGNRATVKYYTAAHPKGATSSTNYLDVPLMVGDNDIRVEIGIANNTSTYKLTVDRAEPAPVVQFRLYDADGDEITPPDGTRLPLELVSATRRYVLDRTDGFTVDVHSVRVNVWLGTGVDADDVKVSVGRVTIPVDSTARGFGGNDPYHTLNLVQGSNTIAFEVEFRQKPDATTLSGRSVHTLTIEREGNSRPTFRPNHGLGQVLIEMVDQLPVDTSTTVMPHARNGNGELKYTLTGKGSTDKLPEGLEFEHPTSTIDGWIYGKPNIEPRSEYAEHTLILSVADSDDYTGATDEDMVEFTIRIYRDIAAKLKHTAPATTGPAQLLNLGVFYNDPADSRTKVDCMATKVTMPSRRNGDQNVNGRTDCGMLVPKFDPATMTYNLEIPTDVNTVDIHAVSKASGQSLTLRGTGSPELGAGSNIFTVDQGKRHEWNGYRVLNGGAAQTDNVYIVKVVEGTTTNEYSLTIRRARDTQVTFSDKAALSYRFYAGILPDGNERTGSDAVTLPAADAGSGNGDASRWTYSLDRTDKGDEVDPKNFEGLMLNASNRMLEGTPKLDTDKAGRLSDRSGAPGEYTVTDADLNTAASDGDSIAVSVTVYRDVTLQSFKVGDVTVDNLGLASRRINNAWSAGDLNDDYSDWVYTWDATDDSGAMLVDAYTFPVAHNATMATFAATANGTSGGQEAKVSISPADTDGDPSNGHQVALSSGDPGRGDNIVVVTVTNGDVVATHKINLVRPGQQASDISVTKDRGRMTGENLAVKLSPEFDRDTYTYTATVESWIQTLRIGATAIDPAATVSVNLDAINTAVGFAEVRLNEPQGSEDSVTTFRIGISNPTVTETPGLYMLTITRKGNTAPKFSSTQDSKTVKNGEPMTLMLPAATGGNGDPVYSLTEAELPNGVSFDAGTRTISGTPQLTLNQGYESDFVLTYSVADMDSDTAASDGDSQMFTLTVTNDDVPSDPAPPGLGPDENYNTLRSLVVSFQRPGEAERVANLTPEFSPSEAGPYTATVPHDAENIWVTPSLSDAGAALWIDNIAQQNARKVKIVSRTEIMVEHTTHPSLGSMTYIVDLSSTDNETPSFAGKSIDIQPLLAGMDMGVVQLPAADGGNTDIEPITYTLTDHHGNAVTRSGIGGIKFDAANRTLSGTPTLHPDADKTKYNLSYQAMDQDGDKSETLKFSITICRSEDLPGCDITGNPGFTPMDVVASGSGSSRVLTWTPGDDATKQLVAAVILNPTTGSLISTIRPAPMGAEVDGNTRRYVFEDLLPASVGTYIFAVWGYDDTGSWKDSSGNAYLGFAQ